MFCDFLTSLVSILKLQKLPTKVDPLIQGIGIFDESITLHAVYKQGLIFESVKYYVMSKLIYLRLVVSGS